MMSSEEAFKLCDSHKLCEECEYTNETNKCLLKDSAGNPPFMPGYEGPAPRQNYWDNITDIQNAQRDKGIRHYGQVLEDNATMSTSERIVAIQEELIDALMYLEHLKVNLAELSEDLK